MSDQGSMGECIGLCDRLAALVEEDCMELRRHLEGDAMESYAELANLEMDLLRDCRRLIEKGW